MNTTNRMTRSCAAPFAVIGLVSASAAAGPSFELSRFSRDLEDHRHVDSIRLIDTAETESTLHDFPLLVRGLDPALIGSARARGVLEAFLDSVDLDTPSDDLFNRGSAARTLSGQSRFAGGIADMTGSTSLNDRTVIPLPTPGLLAAAGLAFVAATRRVRRV